MITINKAVLLSLVVVRNRRGFVVCNGVDGLCQLRYDQVTLAGTHNSGSGFSGNLFLSSGAVAPACFYRNQFMNYTAQLDFGIRWFDIDLCYVTDDEATPAVPAGLWTCHSNGYSGPLAEVLRQVDEWLKDINNFQNIVSLNFNGDYDRSRSQFIAVALHELLENLWIQHEQKRSLSALTMNTDFNETGQWPFLFHAVDRNERVFVFLHETLQLDGKPWAHDLIPITEPGEIVTDSCDGLIDFTRGACDVCTSLLNINAHGSRGNCISETAEICNGVTANVSRACFDLRVQYGKTVNVISVDFPSLAPDGHSVAQIADMLNEINVANFRSPPEDLLNVTGDNCTPGFMPTPSPPPRPQPTTYCEALMQIAAAPIYYFQCETNTNIDCDRLLCNVDIFGNGMIATFQIALVHECGKASVFQMSISLGGLVLGTIDANSTGLYTILNFPLSITLDQMDDAVGLEV